MRKILIIGATSAIAEATGRCFAGKGASLYLLARDQERLAGLASDLKIRGASAVNYAPFDAGDFDKHESVLESAIRDMDGIDVVLIAYGTLGDQKACEKDFGITRRELNTNMMSVISLLTYLANRFEAQRHGTIAVIGSVAGDRGRQSNYVYGTAKGALSVFLQGLRNRLQRSGVHVLTVKPGFVDTPMTSAFPKGLLWSSPKAVAEGIERAIENNSDVVYLPRWWAVVMLIIKLIPERIFKSLPL